jgi:hypothetical protein
MNDAERGLGHQGPLMGLRFRNLRHHVITELVESQASDSTIMALAEHLSRKMLELTAMCVRKPNREAVNVLSEKVPQTGTIRVYGTNNSTNVDPVEKGPCMSLKEW